MKRIIVGLLITLILVSTYFIASKKDDSKENELKSIKVAEVTHSIFYTPLYVAHSLGYFKEQGLDVEIILTSGADKVASAVISKDVQIGFCGSEQTLYIYNKGAKDYLINFAGLTKKDGSFLVSRKQDKSFDLKDLEGKSILGGRIGGMPAMTLNYTLKQKGIKAKVDTSIDFANLSGAFLIGQGDFVTLFEPNALSLEKENKGYVVTSIGEIGGEVPYTTFNTLKSYYDENKDTIKSFSLALQKGIDYTFNHNSKDLAKVIANYFPDTKLDDIEKVIDRYKKIDAWYKNTNIPESGFNHMQDIVDYNGFLDKKVDYKTLVKSPVNE